MRILICPDKFKGSLAAHLVAEAMAKGIHAADPSVEVDLAPMADGGDGTVDAFLSAMGGKKEEAVVTGPLGEKAASFYGVLHGGSAVVEMASASGLAMVPQHLRNPMNTSSIGTGEIIRAALETGAKELIVGIGGSATNDGGMGMLHALGARFYDADGAELTACTGEEMLRVARIDLSGLMDLSGINIMVACDVTNPLCGPEGASAIFGPQKGADAEMIKVLDAGLKNFGTLLSAATGQDTIHTPGAGAAGGVGGALYALGAKLIPGTDLVISAADLKRRMAQCDWVLTGEGATDASTLFGKVPHAMGRLAKELNKPALCLSGSLLPGYKPVYEEGILGVFSIINRPMELNDAMEGAAELLTEGAENITRVMCAFL
ncbi:MAG: glycerate kinase [Clostridiales bacterium]|nr:glycerate kinase [Clostridiales bacterium]